ncbi:MAG TPA: Txe/YoeB family addiction module toxin [Pirellulaceae bacterium]
MNIAFSTHAWEDYLYWHATNKKVVAKIHDLIKDILRHPLTGIGKPEPLKQSLSGYWSRRITDEHRLVYKVTAEAVIIVQLRNHY